MSEGAFWRWSVEVYRRPGVADLLIDLQDREGLSVNLLLWCVYLARAHDADPDAAARDGIAATGEFARAVTAPLRAARRALTSADDAEAAALRAKIKDCELDAERIEQDRLEAFAAERFAPATGGPATAQALAHLEAYWRCAAASPPPTALLARLVALTVGTDESLPSR